MNIFKTILARQQQRDVPMKEGETYEEYFERTFKGGAELFWKLATKVMYDENPKSIPITIETLKDKNPEACKIVEDTYAEIKKIDSNDPLFDITRRI